MKHLLLSALLLAGLAGCTHGSDPTPTPIPTQPTTITLQAKWQADSLWETPSNSTAKNNLYVYPSTGSYLEFTPTLWNLYSNSTLAGSTPYTQNGNTFTTGSGSSLTQYTIKVLTVRRLVFQWPKDGAPGVTKTMTSHR